MFNIVQKDCSAYDKMRGSFLNPVRQFLANGLIYEWCRQCGHTWRQRRFCPVVSLLACIFKQLQCGSARDVEDHLALLTPAGPIQSERDGRDFCNARARLPLFVFQQAVKHTATVAGAYAAQRYKQLKVCLADGTTTRTQRTAQNRKAFHTSTNQHGESRSPIMRLVFLVCAGCGAIIDLAYSPYNVGEARLFALLIFRLASDTLLIADTTACSFMTFAVARLRGSHMLCPLHPERRRMRLKRLGKGETLELWPKSRSTRIAYPLALRQLPDALEVRVIECVVQRNGYRDYKLTLATTLLDPVLYPRHELLSLYLQRWSIETDIRALKHAHGLDILTGKTPQITCREIFSAVLAYNVVRVLIAQAGPMARRISHHRSQQMLCNISSQMAGAAAIHLPTIFQTLLATIRTAIAPAQERPPEPRAILQRQRGFPYLTMSRNAWRNRHVA